MPRFRTVKTIYIKTTAKGDCNITIDLNELKKVPDWVEHKEGQEVRQFFVRRGDQNSIYEVWDEDDPLYPEDETEQRDEDDAPF